MRSLAISGLEKSYTKGHFAIDELELELAEGSFTTLLGPSGCGKTTTLRCLAGLEEPDAGRITFGDDVFVDTEAGVNLPPNKRNLGMVFQSYALWPNKTVMGNVTYPLRLRGTPAGDAKKRAAEALIAVGLDGYGDRYPHELSGGQQQRVALARGLVSASGLLLFDEPLSNLDAKLRLSMREEIRRLHDEFDYSSVYVTHDQEEALAISDYIVVMNEGKMQQAGSPHEIFTQPATPWVAQFVGFDNILDVAVVDGFGLRFAGGGEFSGTQENQALRAGAQYAFRSDEIVLASERKQNTEYLTFRGAVNASSYLGDSYRLHVDIAPETQIIATLHDTSRAHVQEKYVGENLEFAIPVASPRVFA